MIEQLLALIIFLQNPDGWKDKVYETKYNRVILESNKQNNEIAQLKSKRLRDNRTVNISWYAKGLKDPEALTTACWDEYPKGTKFKVSFNGNSVVVICNDRGEFKPLGRMLDLSKGAFERLAPLKFGVIKVNIEVVK